MYLLTKAEGEVNNTFFLWAAAVCDGITDVDKKLQLMQQARKKVQTATLQLEGVLKSL